VNPAAIDGCPNGLGPHQRAPCEVTSESKKVGVEGDQSVAGEKEVVNAPKLARAGPLPA
jgi:hypothetical protein